MAAYPREYIVLNLGTTRLLCTWNGYSNGPDSRTKFSKGDEAVRTAVLNRICLNLGSARRRPTGY
eukprot:SAG31_NODE_663_length_13021_cov_9.408296_5_plen_65_part_00